MYFSTIMYAGQILWLLTAVTSGVNTKVEIITTIPLHHLSFVSSTSRSKGAGYWHNWYSGSKHVFKNHLSQYNGK